MISYKDALELLSQCELGAVVVTSGMIVREANERAFQLLHRGPELIGTDFAALAPALCEVSEPGLYACIAFEEYLLPVPAPEVTELPPELRLLVFRRATAEVQRDRFEHALEQISDSFIMCDEQERIVFLNNAAVRMDDLVPGDVIGEKISSVYEALDGKGLIVPRSIRNRQVYLERRQYYTTKYHKNVDITANTFPVVQNGQVLGGYSVMQDWSAVDNLNKKIIELQEKLLRQKSSGNPTGKSALSARYRFEDIVHISRPIEELLKKSRQAARSDSSVMIYGETGTGKELLAQSIHNESARADRPFLAINCAAIPENLLESLLFGTEKGAFTGAERRPGLFEQANKGTLLLDELNSMNINLQAKLLRVLQDGKVRRVGGTTEFDADVRVISNLNIPPQKAIADGLLRRDLFYRLGVVNLMIPPLRDRREDIPLLAKQFILRYNAKLSRNVRDLAPETMQLFRSYQWPGNVRELEHAIEHAINVLPDDLSVITPPYIPQYISSTASGPQAGQNRPSVPRPADSLHLTMKDVEKTTICKVLRENGGNVSESARVLKMSRQSLQYRMRKYGIRPEDL